MPNTTPNRGYEYPLYQAPTMNFPAQIQTLAEDMSTDVGDLESAIAGAYQRPSAHVYTLTAQSVSASATTAMSFAGGFTDYANGITPNLAASGGVTLTQQGVYLVTGYISLTAPGSGSTFTVQLSLNSNKGYIPTLARVTVRGGATMDSWVSVTSLHYNDGVGNDNIRMDLWQNSAGARTISSKHMSAIKVSNNAGGS